MQYKVSLKQRNKIFYLKSIASLMSTNTIYKIHNQNNASKNLSKIVQKNLQKKYLNILLINDQNN